MSFLVDTNVISEIRKGPRCNPNVAAWYGHVRDDELYLSVLLIGEIRQGIARLRPRAAGRARTIEQWLNEITDAFAERILPINARVAETWGRFCAVRAFPVIDALMAATAEVYGLTLVTRNIRDIADTGVRCLNPFEPA